MARKTKALTLAEYDARCAAEAKAQRDADVRWAIVAQANSRVWDDPRNWK